MLDICGLITIGNSGVGKSFLSNIILNRPDFKHDFSARSVTQRTESTICMIDDKYYMIYNIPGLIEGDEERIALNKQEINRAFEDQQGNPVIVIYVFGHQNGRIRNEDIITFHAIHNAYPFCTESLIIILNGLPPNRPNTYNKDTRTILIDLLKMTPGEICFIDQLNSIESRYERVREQLIDAILNVHPRIHSKVNEINLETKDISKLTIDLNRICIQMNIQREEHQDTKEYMEREFNANKRLKALRSLFFEAKSDLQRLIALNRHKEHLISMMEQWKAQEIGYEDDKMSDNYIQAVKNQKDIEKQSSVNLKKQKYVEAALHVHRRDIEQLCFELQQIYDGKFDNKYESIREYYILFDNLRFDTSINNTKHSFIKDLYNFTYQRFGNIE